MLYFQTNAVFTFLGWRDSTLQIIKRPSMGEKKTVHTTEFTENGGYHGNTSKCQSVPAAMICYMCSAPFKHYQQEGCRH